MSVRLVTRLLSGFGAATKHGAAPWVYWAFKDARPVTQVLAVPHTYWLQPAPSLSWAASGARSSTTAAASAPLPASSNEVPAPTPGSHPEPAALSAASVPAESAAATAPGQAPAPVDGGPASLATATEGGGGVAAAAAPPSEAAALPDPKPELVDKFLSAEMLPMGDQRRVERLGLLRDFQRHPEDTGSPQAMVAMWTHRIRELVRCFDENRKMLNGMRSFEMLVNRRRRYLMWLRRADFDAYSYTITKLGLKDIYTHTGVADRYREGLRPSDPVTDDSVNRLRFSFHRKYRQKKTSMWKRLRPKLVAEDPRLEALDAAAAVADKQHRQEQRRARAQAASQQGGQQQQQQPQQ